ncbi:MAG: hypothetical protein ABSF84_14495 [Acidimicrobiales bacterium]|jgi:hypothetical protein
MSDERRLPVRSDLEVERSRRSAAEVGQTASDVGTSRHVASPITGKVEAAGPFNLIACKERTVVRLPAVDGETRDADVMYMGGYAPPFVFD